MPDNAKRAALIAEGLSEGEADYMTSGGTKSEGLTPPAADGAAAPETPAKTSVEVREAGDPPATAGATPPAPPAPEPDEDEPPQNTPVPYQRFKREKDRLAKRATDLAAELATERAARGTAEQGLGQERERMARLGERLANLAIEQPAAPAAEAAKPTPPPDPEADPIGYIKHLGEQFTALAGKTEKVETTVQEGAASTALERTYVDDARQFVAKQPDFGKAYLWLMHNRDAELKAAGYADPQERSRIILADERDIVARAVQARQANPQAPGPTQILYGIAKARGYAAAAPAAPAPNGAAPANGAPAAPAAPAAPSVTAQVEAIERGRNASRSLSSGGGAPAPTAIDLTKLADMTDGEYLEFKRNMTPAQRSELQGLMGAPAR